MTRLRLLALLLGISLLSGGALLSQDKKDPPKGPNNPPAKLKGQLPQGWGKIGLSDMQKQRIYAIQREYKGEIDKLETKIKELRAEQRRKMADVLTADQKKKLTEGLTDTPATGK